MHISVQAAFVIYTLPQCDHVSKQSEETATHCLIFLTLLWPFPSVLVIRAANNYTKMTLKLSVCTRMIKYKARLAAQAFI